jgi:hypothetical protein
MKHRLLAWLHRSVENAKNKWAIWLLLLVGSLIEDRVVGGINRYLDAHASSLGMNVIQVVVSFPGGLIGMAFVGVLLVLIVHAYLETRPGRALAYRPVLSYVSVSSLDLSWCGLTAHVIVIRNGQDAVMTTANNVRATIRYDHAGGNSLRVDPAGWFLELAGSPTPTTGVFIPMGENRKLVMFVSRPNNGFYVAKFTENSFEPGVKLDVGRWTVHASIRADNCTPLELAFEITLNPDGSVGMRPRTLSI